MPWLLYRYILLDLLRLIGLTTAVLVTVIAFGATLKPLARGGVEAIQIAKYLGLAIVPMLQFALPFAAGFGSTMTFHRLTTDNEIQAMAASGISYRRILLPVAAFGIVLTLFMVVLTQTVIPKFWAVIVQTVTADVVKLFQASIDRGEAFQLGRMQIYADRLVVDTPANAENADGPQTRMILLRVAAADLDESGRIVTDITAASAVVDVYRRESNTYLKMVMKDAVALNAQTGHLVHSERIAPPQAIAVPNVLQQNTKALSRTQLLKLREEPDGYSKVIRAKETLAAAISHGRTREAIDQQLRQTEGGGTLELISDTPAPVQRTYTIKATLMQPNGALAAARSKMVEIVQHERGQPMLRFRTASARLVPASGSTTDFSTAVLFDLVIGDHDVLDLTDKNASLNRRAHLVVPNLRVTGHEVNEQLAKMSSEELLADARDALGDRSLPAAEDLEQVIEKLHHEITGRLASRYAISITACLLLILGATMAMWHRHSLPLTTYVWAFLPAIADLIIISGGEQLLRDGRMWAHWVMWSGNALLLGLFILSAWRLSRN